ncbi:MAG: glycosyltransferase [Rikenellaceae bacterium]
MSDLHNKELLISVIIPIYNVERYLEECVRSVVEQSYKGLEIILVDDGSSDSSGAICDRFAVEDPRVRVFHKESGGVSDARNLGIEKATGDYIIFIDSDDYWDLPTAVERCVKVLAQKPEIDMLYFDFKFLVDGKFKTPPPFDASKINGHSKVEALSHLIEVDRFMVTVWSRFIKRSVLIEGAVNFKKGLLSEDYDWNFGAVIVARNIAAMEDANFYVYRIREGSLTYNTSTQNLIDVWSIITRWYAKIPEVVEDKAEAELYYDFLAYMYAVLMSILHICDNPKVRKDLLTQMRPFAHLLLRHRSGKMKLVTKLYRALGFSLTWRALSLFNWGRKKLT